MAVSGQAQAWDTVRDRSRATPIWRLIFRVGANSRLFAWLQNYRRIVVPYERYPENFLSMLHLACWLILLPVFMR